MLEQIDFYKNIIQNCAVAVFIIDNTHRVKYWNKACENLTGIKAPDIIGTTDQWKAFYGHKRPCLADIVLNGKKEDVSNYYNVFGPSVLMTNGLKAEGWYQFLGERV
jgi:two-component system NtrC family sensor kinase